MADSSGRATLRASCSGGAMMAGPGDEIAGAAGRGHLRASRADREQAIAVLKAAFVQGMLAKVEFDERVGQAFAARTYADLAAALANLPVMQITAQPPKPAGAAREQPVLRPGKVIAAATALYSGVWLFMLLPPWPTNPEGDPPPAMIMLFFSASLIYLFVMVIAAGYAIAGRRQKRSGQQLPRRPAPGAGGPASSRLPPVGPGGQLPPADPDHRYIAKATRRRRPLLSQPVHAWHVGS
jgi:uncharacterized protein DUF1707